MVTEDMSRWRNDDNSCDDGDHMPIRRCVEIVVVLTMAFSFVGCARGRTGADATAGRVEQAGPTPTTAASSTTAAALRSEDGTSSSSTSTTSTTSKIRTPATEPCTYPDNGQSIDVAFAMQARRSGVWLALLAAYPVRTPVLAGTNDNGATWHYHCARDRASAQSVFFIDDVHGWATADEGGDDARDRLIATTDGGGTWTATALSSRSPIMRNVFFLDNRHGWVVGDEGIDGSPPMLARTADGGTTWSQHDLPASMRMPEQVRFVDPLHGWVRDIDREIAATADGGRTWTVRELRDGYLSLRDMVFVDQSHGWALSASDTRGAGALWETTDGGRNWKVSARFDHNADTITVLDDGRLAVTGAWAEALELSDDGGRTWTRRPLPPFRKFAMLDGTTMWGLAGGGCLYHSTDAAETWTAHPLFNTPSCSPAS